jgi:hypothetical protein
MKRPMSPQIRAELEENPVLRQAPALAEALAHVLSNLESTPPIMARVDEGEGFAVLVIEKSYAQSLAIGLRLGLKQLEELHNAQALEYQTFLED